MTAEDAEAAVIRPMRRLYPAPRHLRADEDALEAMLAVYRSALARFDRAALEMAWRRTVEQNPLWCWPKLADLVQASESASRELARAVGAEAWVERGTQMSDEYARKFVKSSQHAVRARQGGYEPQLKLYVREAAWVQAQAILGRDGLGHDASVLFPWQPRDRKAEQEFFEQARRQAESGSIRVLIPRRLLARWQQQTQAEGRGR